MKKITIILMLLAFSTIFGQTYTLTNGVNASVTTCSGTFVDNGGSTSNYYNNQLSTITFYPSTLGSKVKISFSSFYTDGTTSYCYDYLDVWNASTITNPTTPDSRYCGNLSPFSIISTSLDGAITLRFTSNGITTKSGWIATISCATPCNPPTAAFTDSSTVDICPATNPGSSIVNFNASSSTSPIGSISRYEWNWGDGTTSYTTTPITTHSYPIEGIYLVKLKVRDSNYDIDSNGCISSNIATKKIRVLPTTKLPTSSNVISTTCGNSVTLNGTGSSQTITETPYPSPISTSQNSLNQIILNDGVGTSFTSLLDFSGIFPSGSTLQSGCYPTLKFNLEHSYSADLTIDLVSPSGQTVRVFNAAYSGGASHFGSCADANDDGVAGCGAVYTVVNTGGSCWQCIAPIFTPNGTSGTCSNYSGSCEWGSYIVPQTYNSYGSFSALNGATMNGVWKLVITDNTPYDDGALFGWSLSFPNSCYSFNNMDSLTPTISSLNWSTTGNGPAIPTQITTSAPVSNPGPGICPAIGTCVGNILTNNVTVGPFTTSGSYTYTLTATNQFGCQSIRNYTINVTCPNYTITLTTPSNTTNQTKCLAQPISNINYSVTGNPTSVTFSGLPSGIIGSYNSGVVTISGTSSVAGNFNYTITVSGSSPTITTIGTITINPNITPTFTQIAPICLGTTLSALPLVSNNGITGTWSPALNNTATTIYTFTPNVGQCAVSTTMTIIINPNDVLTAVDDYFVVTTNQFQLTTTTSILANDLINGVSLPLGSLITFTQLEPLPDYNIGELIINSDGTITMLPHTSHGYYTLYYQISGPCAVTSYGTIGFNIIPPGPRPIKSYYKNSNEENSIDDFKIYPNPSNGIFFMNFNEIKPRNVEVYNLLGQSVYEKNYFNEKEYSLDLSNLHSGNYVVIINDENHSITKKITKQ